MSEWPNLTIRPIDVWHGKSTVNRSYGHFSAPLRSTLETLERELNALRAKEVVMQIAVGERDIRIDGRPRSDARLAHPGIIISFESKGNPLRFACDRFGSWQENLRAIALGLEVLRKVNRYGIGTGDEQYSGWKALPPGSGAPATGVIAVMSHIVAAQVLIEYGDPTASDPAFAVKRVLSDHETARRVYRQAAAKTHPDTPEGNRADWDLVQQAARVLKAS